ncbi:g10310 [Coccomyxa elongata]
MAFKPSALKPPGAPLRAKQRNPLVDSEDAELLEASASLDTPRKEGVLPLAPVKAWHCQLALALTQTAFCVGSVYLKSCLRKVDSANGQVFHPIIYAFLREVSAGPIMCAMAWFSTGLLPKRVDLVRVMALGLCLYFNQLFYIVGIDMSGVVVATCMQPTIPVFTAMIAVLLNLEAGSLQKFIGITLAVGGSICMVLGGVGGHHTAAEGRHLMLGNMFLLLNTLAMACYYLSAKQLVAKYPAICVAAWSYVTAALCMGATALLFVEQSGWEVPRQLWGPLVYWIFICSVIGYYVVTWATQFLPASQVASFQCLQPMVGTVLAFAVLGEEPSIWDLGAVGVFAGLLLVVYDKKDAKENPVMQGMRRILSQQKLLQGQLSGILRPQQKLKSAKSGGKSAWQEVV